MSEVGLLRFNKFPPFCAACCGCAKFGFALSRFKPKNCPAWEQAAASSEWIRLKADADKIALAAAGSGTVCDVYELEGMGKALEEKWLPHANAFLATHGMSCEIIAQDGSTNNFGVDHATLGVAGEFLGIRLFTCAPAPLVPLAPTVEEQERA